MIHSSTISSIYLEHIDSLYAYAMHLGFEENLALDAIHDVFYKLCISESAIENVTNIKFYLFRALKNRLIDIRRTGKQHANIEITLENGRQELPFKLHVTVEDELIEKEEQEAIRKKVEKVLDKLTDRQREIIFLRYIHEYEYEQIAELMGISVLSCRNLVSKALGILKESSLTIAFILLRVW